MRRLLLTSRSAGAPAFTSVGTASPGEDSWVLSGNGRRVWTDAVADGDGTVTQVQADFRLVNNVAFFTISPANVVRAVSSVVSSVAGTSTYAVSLAVQAGDRIGVYQQSGGAQVDTVTGGGDYYYDATNTVPTVGATLTPTQVSGRRATVLGTP